MSFEKQTAILDVDDSEGNAYTYARFLIDTLNSPIRSAESLIGSLAASAAYSDDDRTFESIMVNNGLDIHLSTAAASIRLDQVNTDSRNLWRDCKDGNNAGLSMSVKPMEMYGVSVDQISLHENSETGNIVFIAGRKEERTTSIATPDNDYIHVEISPEGRIDELMSPQHNTLDDIFKGKEVDLDKLDQDGLEAIHTLSIALRDNAGLSIADNM